MGFTYNGIHSSQYHVEFIPDADDRWFEDPDWKVYQTDVDWRHGGYYNGNAVKVRTFNLKCFYEEITTKQREDIRHWLHRDTSGTLMFDDLPFVYWNVRPTKLIQGTKYNDTDDTYSGTFTVQFSAFEPFGFLTRKSNGPSDNDNATDYCGLIATANMPAAPTTASRSFQVYNPGTEKCGLTIRVSGTATKQIRFFNSTNKTQCMLRSLPSSNLVLDLDGKTGNVQVYVYGTTSKDNGFAYHDRGFIRLEPGMNQIVIQEITSNGNWTAPTGLTLTRIEVDYAPMIL